MIVRPLLAAFALCLALPAAAADLVRKTSPHSVATTIDRLEAAVENAGATVFARVDHAQGAANIGSELAPAQMLMFGNPRLGTPAMQASITAGLDLPLRVLAYEDADGSVQLVYHAPATMAATHGIAVNAEVITQMTGALGNLTDAAIAPE